MSVEFETSLGNYYQFLSISWILDPLDSLEIISSTSTRHDCESSWKTERHFSNVAHSQAVNCLCLPCWQRWLKGNVFLSCFSVPERQKPNLFHEISAKPSWICRTQFHIIAYNHLLHCHILYGNCISSMPSIAPSLSLQSSDRCSHNQSTASKKADKIRNFWLYHVTMCYIYIYIHIIYDAFWINEF